MTDLSKSRYHHGDLRQSLIAAAIALIQELGVGDLSLRQVARRVGVSHNAPYRHFADKEALLAAVAEEGFRALAAGMAAAYQAEAPGSAAGLAAIGFAYVGFALGHPAHYRVMFSDFRGQEEAYPSLLEAGRQAFGVLVAAIGEGQTVGTFKPADPRQLAWVAWALVHGQALLLLDQRLRFESPEEQAAFLRFCSRQLLEGIGQPPALVRS